MKLVMPMAGLGSRFYKNGVNIPKPIIDVKGKPMFVQAERCIGLDFTEHIFITRKEHNLSEHILQWYPKAIVKELDYLTQGTACTLLTVQEFLKDDSFLICNCDQYATGDSKELRKLLDNSTTDACIALFEDIERNPKWSFAKIEQGNITQIAEKVVISQWATVGWYYWKNGQEFIECAKEMIKNNDRVNNEFYACPVYNYLIKDKTKNVKPFFVNEMYGMGTPEDLEIFLNK